MNRILFRTLRVGSPLMFLFGAFAVTQQAQAAPFLVNDTTDAVDTVPGDGACETAGATCTLRAAVQEANALAGSDSIQVPAGTYNLTISGNNEDAAATGDLDITSTISFTGGGANATIIDASALATRDRVFHVLGATTRFRRLQIRGGQRNNGGGISNIGGDVLLANVTVEANVALNDGGGLYNSGIATMDINNSTITGNSAAEDGGGIANRNGAFVDIDASDISENFAGSSGGGLHNFGVATARIADSDIFENEAGGVFSEGGGIVNLEATLSVEFSSVRGNSAGTGGGIYHEEDSFFADTALFYVTVEDNTATGAGGGGGVFALNGDFDINLSTVEGNTAAAGDGGGMTLDPDSNTYAVSQTEVVGNTASGNGGGIVYLGSAFGAGNISRCTIQGNTATHGAGLYLNQPSDFNMNVVKSTVSGNNAALNGGGLYLAGGVNTIIYLASVTVTDNDAPGSGGGIYVANNVASYVNYHVLLAENTAGAGQNCDGDDITSAGFNLVGHDTGCNFLAVASDQVGTLAAPIDPLIGTLQDNGGTTLTHELLQGSPAIDRGNGISCTYGGASDQRGFMMPVAECDIGAYERQ